MRKSRRKHRTTWRMEILLSCPWPNCLIIVQYFLFTSCFWFDTWLFYGLFSPVSHIVKDTLITLRMKSCLTLALPRSPCHRHLPVRQLRRPCLYGMKNDEQLSVFPWTWAKHHGGWERWVKAKSCKVSAGTGSRQCRAQVSRQRQVLRVTSGKTTLW